MSDDQNRNLRNALGCFATGITVVTTLDAEEPVGMTVNSFASVSLEPPLVSWCLAKKSHYYDIFMATDIFAINVLSEHQEHISQLFASADENRFTKTDWQRGHHDLPLLSGCIAHLECRTEHLYPGGDHTILVGRILSHSYNYLQPLIFSHSEYKTLK